MAISWRDKMTFLLNKRFLYFIVVGLSLATAIPLLLAHGGGELQVVNAPVAGYVVSVWTAPNVPQAGQDLHVTVGVGSEALGATPVLDAQVSIAVYAEDGRLVASAPATTDQSVNKLFYEADLPGLAAGNYRFVVTVSGATGSGDVEFSLAIQPSASRMPYLIAGIVLLGLGGTAVFWYRRKNQKIKPD